MRSCFPATRLALAACMLASLTASSFSQANQLPSVDRRAVEVRTLNTLYSFPAPSSKEEWLARSQSLRQQILASAGLWPLPKKQALNARIFGKVERENYSVEKVYFESLPGFYVTGNLYRPLGKDGPFPAVLAPHGHWAYGRLENTELSSDQGLCINLARRGLVAFSYDMVGYNDGGHIDHYLKQGNGNRRAVSSQEREFSLWGFGTLSLQLWNSIRAVDFLESLPDVDRDRLGCTGASGGGTQTFLLSAIDARIKAAAPVNMISHSMQGGCACENTAHLRLDTNNMELAALIAPRPLLMVSATGDWTRDTLRLEYPAMQSIYKLFGAEDKVHAMQVDAPHNYNRESREAVYAWFDRWLLGRPGKEPAKEPNFSVEPLGKLLVFHNKELPAEAKTQEQLFAYLKASSEEQMQALRPRDTDGLLRFRETMGPALRHSLAAEYPQGVIAEPRFSFKPGAAEEFFIGRAKHGDRIPAKIWMPQGGGKPRAATLLVHPKGTAAFGRAGGDLVEALLKENHLVMTIDAFNTNSAQANRDTSSSYFTTYNRSDDANRVQDILTALAYLKETGQATRLNLVGLEEAGLWCLLARALAPELTRTAADVAQFDAREDSSFLRTLYIPLIKRAGDFRTALALAAPSQLLIHNTGGKFDTEWVRQTYQIAAVTDRLRTEDGKLPPLELARWLK